MEQLQSPLSEDTCLRSSKRNGTIMNLVYSPTQRSRSRNNSISTCIGSTSPLSQEPEPSSDSTNPNPSPSHNYLCNRSKSSETNKVNFSFSSTKFNQLTPRHPTGLLRSVGYRHTMYYPQSRSSEERGIIRDLEKLRLDTPRLSFETDTDSDRHSLIDGTFTTDDLTDLSSNTSEIRRSIDSLTPSEMDQIASEYKAELTLEEALMASSDEMFRYLETNSINQSNNNPPNIVEESSKKISISTLSSGKPEDPKPDDDPKTYLKYLETTFHKDELGSLLAKNDGFHKQVLDVFLDSLKLENVPIDMALRNLVSILYLPKEGQQIDRIITVFSKRYFEANPKIFSSEDVVYSLTFSLLLLHTDAHNKLVKHKMTKEEYIKQTRKLDDSTSIPTEILEILYDNITNVEFLHLEEEPSNGPPINATDSVKKSWFQKLQEVNQKIVFRGTQTLAGQDSSGVKIASLMGSFLPDKIPFSYISSQNVFADSSLKSPFTMRVKGLTSFFQQPQMSRPVSGFSISHVDEINDITELRCLKEGLILRKSDINEVGRKAHLRVWREFWAVLAGSQLVLFKEVSVMRMRQRLKSDALPVPKPYSITSVANVIAVVDHEYTKHANVFRFSTSDGRQYLFRAESKQDMEEWMAKINFTAAFKSSDVLPRGVSSQVFDTWRQGLPQIKNFDFEVDDQEALRGRVIRLRITHLDKQIQIFLQRIESEKLLLHQLSIMVVLTKSAHDCALLAIDRIRLRLRRKYLALQRFNCYREILLQDLALATLSLPPTSN